MVMIMFVFERVCAGRVCGVRRLYGQKGGDEGTVLRRTPRKYNTGTPNAHPREKNDTKSPYEIYRPDFSSPSMVTGQVAWWCVGRERNRKR